MPKKCLVAFAPGLLDKLDAQAKREHRNRSDFIREACRVRIEQAEEKRYTRVIPANSHRDLNADTRRLSPQEHLDFDPEAMAIPEPVATAV